MKVWSEVCQTDPAHTKKVNFGREFTAIDATYQVMNATKTFGPIGRGWGYECTYNTTDRVVICQLTLWWETRENWFGPIMSVSSLVDSKGRIDKDAGKKAMTDALTKALSHLGFNADVFLGKFDDNNYVTEMTKQFSEPKPEDIVKFEAAVEAATTLQQLHEINATYAVKMTELKGLHSEYVTAAAAKWAVKKVAFTKAEKSE